VRTRRALIAVSAGQLAVQACALAVGVRRGLAFDYVPLAWRSSGDAVARDAMLLGTPISAPAAMLLTQAVATTVLRSRPSPVAARTLWFLGWAMIAGYLGERQVQRRLLEGEWDPIETPLAAAGLAGAAAMTVLGLGAKG